MKRRDFLLNMLLACSAFSCSGCSYINNDKKIDLTGIIDIIEFPIVYHCNLRCASCTHFAPIAPKYFMPFEIFEKDCKKLRKIDKYKCIKRVNILGGEPLLHKDIEKFIYTLGDNFPYAKKYIITNGLLLEKMNQSFWDACSDSNVEIRISEYPVAKKYFNSNLYKKLVDKHKDSVIINKLEYNKFRKINLDKNFKEDDSQNFNKCYRKNFLILDNGKLSICTVMNYIRFFNIKFPEYAIYPSKKDFLNIYKVKSIDEILHFLSTPKDFCKYCHYGHDTVEVPWKLTKQELSEWYRI